jgi:DNA-directed RNA polymerase specialized sigma24 family protein
VLDERWLDEFEAQATPALFEKATRYATSRAWGVAKWRGKDDDLYVQELVQDAFGDTLSGTIAWDPTRASLEAHIINAIRGRSRHDRVHARRYRAVEVDHKLAAEPADGAGDRAELVMLALQELAADDREVVALLEAFSAGACEKAEAMAAAKLGAKPYRNARIRLARLVKQLPPELAPVEVSA